MAEPMNAIVRDLPDDVVRKAYRRWARVYDGLCGPLFRPAHAAAAQAANAVAGAGGDIAEIGVGTGLMLPLYAPHTRVTGIDLSPDMLARARERVVQGRLAHVVALEAGDIHDLAHPNARYDAIVLPFVLTLLARPEAALDNCWRMLRPGGQIIIVSHFRSRHAGLARFEQWLAPLIAGVGLRPDFAIERIELWASVRPRALMLKPQSVGAAGVYTLVRIARL
jgi:phosphatidylethanolamine/phosphatidyl-N-methylethanolamine N-methyltransferase